MAGDWIKIEHTLPDKPEVIAIAARLRMDQDAVTGKLLRLWAWADQNCIAGDAITITAAFIDRMVDKKGFAAAMRSIGWLIGEDGAISFPNFGRHNGTTAKARAESNRRMAKSRQSRNGSCEDVAENSQQKPQPEKRREENIRERDTAGAGAGIRRPSLDQAISAAPQVGVTPEMAEDWWNAREASAWVKATGGGGTTPVGANWQADLKTYASRMGGAGRTAPPGPQSTGTHKPYEWEKQ